MDGIGIVSALSFHRLDRFEETGRIDIHGRRVWREWASAML